MNDYENLRSATKNIEENWKNANGFASGLVLDKLDKAMLSWVTELTDALEIWINIGLSMTDGELILAYTNLGALVECWLKFFFCIHLRDYLDDPVMNRSGEIIQPNKMSLEGLKMKSIGILWESTNHPVYKWVSKIQHRRNAIHAFDYRDIGTPDEFRNDVNELNGFVGMIINLIPPIEDYKIYLDEGYR